MTLFVNTQFAKTSSNCSRCIVFELLCLNYCQCRIFLLSTLTRTLETEPPTQLKVFPGQFASKIPHNIFPILFSCFPIAFAFRLTQVFHKTPTLHKLCELYVTKQSSTNFSQFDLWFQCY